LWAHSDFLRLFAAGTVPYVLFGLFAGVWVDRLRCRSVLVAADFGRAVLLAADWIVASPVRGLNQEKLANLAELG
jgi:hypothetical protein